MTVSVSKATYVLEHLVGYTKLGMPLAPLALSANFRRRRKALLRANTLTYFAQPLETDKNVSKYICQVLCLLKSVRQRIEPATSPEELSQDRSPR